MSARKYLLAATAIAALTACGGGEEETSSMTRGPLSSLTTAAGEAGAPSVLLSSLDLGQGSADDGALDGDQATPGSVDVGTDDREIALSERAMAKAITGPVYKAPLSVVKAIIEDGRSYYRQAMAYGVWRVYDQKRRTTAPTLPARTISSLYTLANFKSAYASLTTKEQADARYHARQAITFKNTPRELGPRNYDEREHAILMLTVQNLTIAEMNDLKQNNNLLFHRIKHLLNLIDGTAYNIYMRRANEAESEHDRQRRHLAVTWQPDTWEEGPDGKIRLKLSPSPRPFIEQVELQTEEPYTSALITETWTGSPIVNRLYTESLRVENILSDHVTSADNIGQERRKSNAYKLTPSVIEGINYYIDRDLNTLGVMPGFENNSDGLVKNRRLLRAAAYAGYQLTGDAYRAYTMAAQSVRVMASGLVAVVRSRLANKTIDLQLMARDVSTLLTAAEVSTFENMQSRIAKGAFMLGMMNAAQLGFGALALESARLELDSNPNQTDTKALDNIKARIYARFYAGAAVTAAATSNYGLIAWKNDPLRQWAIRTLPSAFAIGDINAMILEALTTAKVYKNPQSTTTQKNTAAINMAAAGVRGAGGLYTAFGELVKWYSITYRNQNNQITLRPRPIEVGVYTAGVATALYSLGVAFTAATAGHTLIVNFF